MILSIKDFFSKYDQIRKKLADLVTFTEEILNGKLHFLCSSIGLHLHGNFPSQLFYFLSYDTICSGERAF